MSDSLRPQEPQHARPPCPSPAPRVHPNPCPLSRWCHPTISSSVVPFLLLPSIFPSIRVFSNESVLCIRWPKYWSFSFNISPSNEHPGLISFRTDWLDLLAVQGTLKSLLQHHSSKASILQRSTFIIIQLSHPYMTIGQTIALTRRTFVDKVMSLLLCINLTKILSSILISFCLQFRKFQFPVPLYLKDGGPSNDFPFCCPCSVAKSCPWTAARQTVLPSAISWSLLKFVSVVSLMLSNHVMLCQPLLLLLFNLPQHQGLFQWVCSSHQVVKVSGLQL